MISSDHRFVPSIDFGQTEARRMNEGFFSRTTYET